MVRQQTMCFVTYNSVEFAPFVALRLPFGILAFARTKLSEILCSTRGDVGKKFHLHSAQGLACDNQLIVKNVYIYVFLAEPTCEGDIKENYRIAGIVRAGIIHTDVYRVSAREIGKENVEGVGHDRPILGKPVLWPAFKSGRHEEMVIILSASSTHTT
jgi:hypothetical protein